MKTGPNQHFIPQVLLRRFVILGDTRVHVYQLGLNEPRPTKKVASGRHYYSKPKEGEGEPLDSIITRHENGPFNVDFQALLGVASGRIDPALAARIIAHLAGRGDHLRGMIRSGATALGDLLGELFSSSDNLARLVGADGPMPGPVFCELFGPAIVGNELLGQLSLPQPVLESLAYMLLRENMEEVSEVGKVALSISETLRTTAPSIARAAQVKALTDTLVPEARITQLTAFTWQLVDMPGSGAILPDFVILARDADGKTGTIFTFDPDQLVELLMPLSPCVMLIGQAAERDPQLANFNADCAPHCRDFFVSSYVSAELEALAECIGKEADAPIREGLAEAAAVFRAKAQGSGEPLPVDAGPWREVRGRNFEIETDQYSDEDARRLGNTIARLVEIGRDRFDTDNLWRVVVRADYARVIAAVERGTFDDGTILAPSTAGESIAYNVAIERGGEHGVVMVLDPDIGAALLDDNDLVFGSGASVVLSQLARIGGDQLLGTVFANGFVEGEAHDLYLMQSAIWCWKVWLVAQFQSMFTDDLAAWYRAQAIERLIDLPEILVEARRIYRTSGDIDSLLETAVTTASSVLSALLCAAASGGDEVAIARFRDELAAIGWGNWFALLERDVAAIWTLGTTYPKPSDFLVLSRHLQRLLLAGAIFLWTTPEGQLMVEVPYWSDFDWIAERVREVRDMPVDFDGANGDVLA